ncbi:MAG TPA: hypothetical protein VKB38_10900 [Terracidiphilus sp.]|nr:hypothetical protein [Terracidiphilus sp.]
MLTASAGSDGVGIGELETTPNQFDQRFLALPAVNVQDKDAAFCAGHNPNVRIRPAGPPFADCGGIAAGVI